RENANCDCNHRRGPKCAGDMPLQQTELRKEAETAAVHPAACRKETTDHLSRDCAAVVRTSLWPNAETAPPCRHRRCCAKGHRHRPERWLQSATARSSLDFPNIPVRLAEDPISVFRRASAVLAGRPDCHVAAALDSE